MAELSASFTEEARRFSDLLSTSDIGVSDETIDRLVDLGVAYDTFVMVGLEIGDEEGADDLDHEIDELADSMEEYFEATALQFWKRRKALRKAKEASSEGSARRGADR